MPDAGIILFLQQATSAGRGQGAVVVFLLYTAVVFGLAWAANRLLARRSFMGEYFLGSRSLGMVALALTYGATSASAGSFAGFPALIYTHGWVLALWIASYMIFPLCGMGLLGKRLNQVARKTGAITIPDLLRERFDSRALALVSTLLMALLLTVYLIPQFKLAALIMEQLLSDAPLYQQAATALADFAGGRLPAGAGPEYLVGLFLFAGLVILYTTIGGFRAVVWTDVLQGFVMIFGVLLMLVLAVSQAGGPTRAGARLQAMTPPELGQAVLTSAAPAPAEGFRLPADSWAVPEGSTRLVRTNQGAFIPAGDTVSGPVAVVAITSPEDRAAVLARFPEGRLPGLPEGIALRTHILKPYTYGAGHRGVYLTAPGPSPDQDTGFLPLGLAISFFVFWALSGTGQPGNMVRLMAFDRARTLKRATAALSVYFTLVYLPLVVIFVCARIIVPGLDQTPDRIMPVMAFTLTEAADLPWLAGLLIAAPFAAAMSTVDSFLLMISSSFVRDIYQRNINPDVRERTVKRMSYACTLIIGLVATAGAVNPPQFLQYLIVFTGGGLAVAFLAPVALGVYWPRFNRQGAMAAMLGGVGVYLAQYLIGFIRYGTTVPIRPLGLDPLIWGFAASLLAAWVVTALTPPPPERLIARFFYRNQVSDSP